MPKLPTKLDLQRWRDLRAQGKGYPEIARKTKWQARTIRKHLEQDINSAEALAIRRDLFKERLGAHWDKLLHEVLRVLDLVQEPSASDLRGWTISSDSVERHLCGTRVKHTDQEKFEVRVQAKDLLEWELLQQHVPKDALWEAVANVEAAFGLALLACRTLFLLVLNRLTQTTGLPVADYRKSGRLLTDEGVGKVFEYTLAHALLARPFDEHPRAFQTPGGDIQMFATTVARLPRGREKIERAVIETIQQAVTSPGATKCKEIHQRLLEAISQMRRHVAYFRLLPYLPGVCSVCRKVEI
ncbi:MAG: hypothetical protein FJ039_02125 [Chloroflexi bacterium]|nr:hypothetical protein [Chloroflexota bacterium]